MGNIKQSILAGLFSIITIGILTLLTYKTEFGIFLIASFGSSMVLLYGYPESPFAQPKNVFFRAPGDYNCRFNCFTFCANASFYYHSISRRFWSKFNDFI